MKRRAKLVGFFVLSMWAGITFAVEGEVESAKVSKVLTQLFDRPNSRLTVDAVAVASDHSLASWSQAGRGGRALLKRVSGKWQIVLCGGKELMHVDALKKAGVPAADARTIGQHLTSLELKLPAAKRLAFDSFVMEQGKSHASEH
jgi:hypothetical protein